MTRRIFLMFLSHFGPSHVQLDVTCECTHRCMGLAVCWDCRWLKIMGLLMRMMMMPVNWATHQTAPAAQMGAGQSGLWNHRVNQVSHTGLLMMFTFWAESAHVSVVWPSSWLITLHSLKGWVGVFRTNLDWHLWLDFIQLIDWMRHVCRFSSWSDTVFFSCSLLFLFSLPYFYYLCGVVLHSRNEIIEAQMKLFFCGLLFFSA